MSCSGFGKNGALSVLQVKQFVFQHFKQYITHLTLTLVWGALFFSLPFLLKHRSEYEVQCAMVKCTAFQKNLWHPATDHFKLTFPLTDLFSSREKLLIL